MTVLTLQLNDEVMRRVEKLAAIRDVSAAEMAARLLDVSVQDPLPAQELPPFTRKAMGSVQEPLTDAQIRQVLADERARRFEQE